MEKERVMSNRMRVGMLSAMALMFSVGVAGPVHATALPMEDKIVISQSQVPPKCQKIKDPVKRQACLRENSK
ncbi:MAG: hypothetical protein RIB59_10060 [Rhodospirillales bacterium]